MDWETIWKFVLVLFVTLFGVMAVLVTVLGGRDVVRLLRHLRGAGDREDETHFPK